MKCCVDRIAGRWILSLALLLAALAPSAVRAGTPLSLYTTHAGSVDYIGTGGTLRAASNAWDGCSVIASDSSPLSGIPATATVTAAYLYWAGSYSNNWTSTRTTPDNDVIFDGQAITADRVFTEVFNYGGRDYDFFSGFKDVTGQVAAKRNGTYSFSGLEVNTDWPHCPVQAVVAGWSLIVVYNTPGGPNRIVNVYDGFQFYRGGEIALTMTNFRIAAAGIDGKASHLTWEGDAENSGSLGGYSENMLFNGNSLTDAFNPLNNQFNSTVNWVNSASEWGVDFDVYDISPYLNPGDSSATAVYRSGQDLVLLSAEVISVVNAPSADLSLSMSVAAPMTSGNDGEILVTVTNNGPSDESGPVQITGTLPAGFAYLGTSAGWLVDLSAAPTYTWRGGSALPAGSSQTFSIYVRPDFASSGNSDFTASVSGVEFDYSLSNNTDVLTINVGGLASEVVVVQFSEVASDPINGTTNPKAIPGALVTYTLTVSNQLPQTLDDDSVVLITPVPPGTIFRVEDLAAAGDGPVGFQEGVPGSGLTYQFNGLRNRRDDLQFSRNGGGSFNYRPRADANGCDANITHVRVTPQGGFQSLGGSGAPNFSLRFQVRVR